MTESHAQPVRQVPLRPAQRASADPAAPGASPALTDEEARQVARIAGAIARGVYRFAPSDAEDAIQEVQLILVENRAHVVSVEDYAAVVTRNVCRKMLRRRLVRARHEGGLEGREADADPERATDRCLSVARFMKAVYALSAECRRLIHALFVRALPHRRAAEMLGLAPGSVHRSKEGCLNALRRAFAPYGARP